MTVYDPMKCAFRKPGSVAQEGGTHGRVLASAGPVAITLLREGLAPWLPGASVSSRLTALSWKSGLWSEELGRRTKAWIFITGERVTFPGVKVKSGSDSGDASSSTSMLGYVLASWRESRHSEDSRGHMEIQREDQMLGPKEQTLKVPSSSSRDLCFPELLSPRWLLLEGTLQ